jgi:steroid 5-alpha reductase family enzyme
MSLSLYVLGLVSTLGLATLTWVASVLKRDVSIVDGVWALMLLAAATVYATGAEPYTGRTTLILTLVVLWALRLSGHIIHRNWGEPEDRRYRDIRQKYEPNFALKSLGLIFWFQAGLAWIISLPLWPALTVPVDGGAWDVLAVTVWTVGMIFEGVGDWQLSRFKADPANHGKVMDRGLWRYTRHPNYFGECLIWWGFSLFALPAGAWWTVVGPLSHIHALEILRRDLGGADHRRAATGVSSLHRKDQCLHSRSAETGCAGLHSRKETS